MAKEWQIEKRKLSALKLLKNNPRQIGEIEFEQLKEDLKLGKFKPFIIDNNNVILAGNQTYKALIETESLNSEWDCSVPQFKLTEKERKKIILLDNKHRGEDDIDILANEFEEELEELGFYDLLPNEYIGEESEPNPKMQISFKKNDDMEVVEKEIKEVLDKYNLNYSIDC